MPGSLETETYAATVAALRTSGTAIRWVASGPGPLAQDAQRKLGPGPEELVPQGQFA